MSWTCFKFLNFFLSNSPSLQSILSVVTAINDNEDNDGDDDKLLRLQLLLQLINDYYRPDALQYRFTAIVQQLTVHLIPTETMLLETHTHIGIRTTSLFDLYTLYNQDQMLPPSNSDSSSPDNVYGAVIMALPLQMFTRFIYTSAAEAPGGCRPLHQNNRSEPQICL